MAKQKKKRSEVKTKFAGTRVDGEMDRWLRGHQKKAGRCRATVVLVALQRYRRDLEAEAKRLAMVAEALELVPTACSCSPDDRAKDGCTCAAGVGR